MQKYLQKAIQILEKNVEWFALGLGAFFLLYMAWMYLITKPVFKALPNNIIVTPGNVDETIDSNSGDQLRKLMDVTDDEVPKFPINNFSDAVPNALAMNNARPGQIAGPVWNFQPVQLSEIASSGTAQVPQAPQNTKITVLPVLPAGKALLVESGKTTVSSALPPPVIPSGANGAPPPPVTPPPALPEGNGLKDIEWTTVAFSIPADALSQQWKRAFGPEKPGEPWKVGPAGGQVMTQFLSVTAYRSEKLPDGSWGPEEQVPRLWNSTIPAYPAAGDKTAEQAYLGAIASTLEVATPNFPDMAAGSCGTVWKDPVNLLQGLAAKAATPIAAAGAPGAGGLPAVAPLASPGGAAAPAALVIESSDPTVTTANGVPPSILPIPPTGTINPTALPASPPPASVPGAPAAPQNARTAVAAAAAPPSDILVYAIDAAIKPGKTYRYRMAYTLLNPLFNHSPDNFQAAWADQFDLTSPRSDYSPEVTVPLRTYFYCAQPGLPGVSGDKLTFNFEVFSWGLGVWNKHTFTVNPGDEIGNLNNGIDYSTGYTYVDQRKQNSQRSIVTLMDSDGTPVIRDAEQDVDGPDHKLRTQWVDTQAGMVAGPAVAGQPRPAFGAAAIGQKKTQEYLENASP
jgi:hypothetical protein